MALPLKQNFNLLVPHPHPPAIGVAVPPFPISNDTHRLSSTYPLPPVPFGTERANPPHREGGKEKEMNGSIGGEKRTIFKKVVLVILDGFGVASKAHGNAIAHAKIPTLDYLVANFPSLTLHASGPLVGLPWGEMGNSEVGHLNIGAGRIVGQDLPRITASVQNGEFFKNKTLLEAIMHSSRHNSKLHLMGLVSKGGVHSLDEHLYALLALAEDKGLRKVYIHMFTDGRDTAEKVALEDIKKLRQKIVKIGVGEIATITGRFYAMDRGGHWDQTELTYQALVNGKGENALSAEDCIWRNYQSGIYDEMIKPTVMNEIGQGGSNYPTAVISDNDAVIFFNFRQDRALQLSQMFLSPEKIPQSFRQPPIKNLFFATMTEYAQNLPAHAAFLPIELKNNLAETLFLKGFSQFHISESEKYAHVTSFFDCGRTKAWPKEERKIVSSPDNARNYVDHPEMSADELADILIAEIARNQNNFFLANFANADMVGHTGSLKSGITAVEILDKQLKKILDSCLNAGACLIITADHGNIEQMIDLTTGDINKDHTSNPVPMLIADKDLKFARAQDINYLSLASRIPDGSIGDIAPTILELFGIEKPKEMTGVSLLATIKHEV
ncbi:MAG: 2,3-bisphosphoglycerate-independent phosphoglycerate mutase [Candidatus Doudnabacteria bacterium]|nr:2,3-bisphosphoglycerate-independent phosphoglycerate mutase [Candidatus Doudnabacteria bacterium]